MKRFRLLRGVHGDKNGKYKKGDIIETETDLVEKFNADGFPAKFQRLEDTPDKRKPDTSSVAVLDPEEDEDSDPGDTDEFTREDIESMNVKELRELAEENEIDISGAKGKQAILKAILAELDA